MYQFTYTILLQLVCGVQSFRSRKLPENYNEAGHITLGTYKKVEIKDQYIFIFLYNFSTIGLRTNVEPHFKAFNSTSSSY